MRIVIDFLDGLDAVPPGALAQATALARACADHEVWLAVPAGRPDEVETLRLATAGLQPRPRVRPFALAPAGVPDALHAPLRRHALAGLEPDVVLAFAAAPGAQAKQGDLPTVIAAPGENADALRRRIEATAAEASPALPAAPGGARPRLAYVSPLPPERSGIADYSAELAPELARWYDVELIVDQDRVQDARLDGLPQRSPAWLREHADSYQRVLYHFGNSPVHKHMFDLVRDVPGVVLMHDFYFGNVLDYLENTGYTPQAFVQGLYESHGYAGLLGVQRGRVPSVWNYPVNKGVLDNATGVIVHSEYAKELARRWYGPDAGADWRTIPLLRGKPPGAQADPAAARRAARARLKLADDEFVVCSFGMLGPTKLNKEVLAAFLASPLAADKRCSLVFVGDSDAGRYDAELTASIRASDAARRIRITGFVDPAGYADWLNGCDAAVQLRGSSRGETSAAVLDCLLYGVPTVVNAHGSAASIPDDLLVKLPDAVDVDALADAFARLRADAGLRATLSARAAAYMRDEHAPEHAASLCRDAIEHFARRGASAAYRQAVRASAPLCPEPALPQLAGALAFDRPARAPRQLLVDVSAMVQHDLKTGIQRVVRSIVMAMIAHPPAGFRVEPVFTTGGGRSYHYARRYTLDLVGAADLELEDAPVDLRPGDVFFGLDLYLSGTAQNEGLLREMRARGVLIYFCMYDLLPLLRPDVFPFGTEQHFEAFVRTVHAVADGIVCISRAVADELADWLARKQLARRAPLQLGWFHLGADIAASLPSTGLPPDAGLVLGALKQRPSFLMVGTVEPRKGHTQALAAFDLLWERGEDVNLVVVGKQGWLMETLAERMNNHPEKDRRLFWLAGISDEMLQKLYAGSSALLAPSEGEGFGLPLIEAAQLGIPIVARGLPVFREVAGEHAHYFDGLAPADLADAIVEWLALWRAGAAPTSSSMPWLTWAHSTHQVLDALVGGRWYRTLPGTEA